MQWFLFTYLGESWSQDGMRLKNPELVQWAEKVFAQEDVICFDIYANKRGAIDPDHIRQVRAVREVLDKK